MLTAEMTIITLTLIKMSTFISRLLDEQSELNKKIINLEVFTLGDLFQDLDEIHQSLLKIQLISMKTYEQVLSERIKYLNQ